MRLRFDPRTFALIAVATLLGAAWAGASFVMAGAVRDDTTVQPLVWAIFATPLASFLGWAAARRSELTLASCACLCVYLFAPFVGARIETIVAPSGAAPPVGPHGVYFIATIALQAIAGLACALWRARVGQSMAERSEFG